MAKFSCIYNKIKSSIVTISSKYITRPNNKFYNASGFLVEKNNEIYVITSAHIVLGTTVDDPMDEMKCGVYDINGEIGNNQIYGLRLLGIDGLADVAICKLYAISYDVLPKLGSHPTIKFKDNLDVSSAIDVYNISNPLGKDLFSVDNGMLRDHKFFYNNQSYRNSLITTNLSVFSGSSGSPVLDSKGRCLGIISFGFNNVGDQRSETFSGGSGSHTIEIILDNIVTGKHVNIINKRGLTYFSNRKGWMGDVKYSTLSPILGFNSSTEFKLPKLTGMIMSFISKDSPLSKPIKGNPVNPGDIILSMTNNNKEEIIIGTSDNRYSSGIPLWTFDPEEKPISKIKVSRFSEKGYLNIDEIEVVFDTQICSCIERPPTDNNVLGLTDDCNINLKACELSCQYDFTGLCLPGCLFVSGTPLCVGLL